MLPMNLLYCHFTTFKKEDMFFLLTNLALIYIFENLYISET